MDSDIQSNFSKNSDSKSVFGAYSAKRKHSGFTMVELIIVMALVAIGIVILLGILPNQLSKSRDGRRKSDLSRIKNAFEEYYNDRNEYPPEDILLECDGTALAPYLSGIPCDPGTGEPYVYVPHPSSADPSKGFRVFAALENSADPVVTTLNCVGGCGLLESYLPDGSNTTASSYTYGVSQGVPVSFNDNEGNGVEPIPGYRCGGTSCNVCDQGTSGCIYTTLQECVDSGCNEMQGTP